jgi:hypothetical protein
VTVPVPLPKNVTVKIADPLLVPVKQTTFAVVLPVTIAPDELRPLVLEFVWTVADTNAPVPQTFPVAVSKPVELTVTIWVLSEPHVTWSVMSFVTGG